ncbi:MAG: allantoinase AllB [Chloroflexota bacterium]
MTADLYLKNAVVVTETELFEGGVVATDGQITQWVLGDLEVDATTVVDLEGKTLLPGIVDGHVHFNEPGRTGWEGYQTGTMAAAAGGITTVIDMPLNATPPTINVDELANKRAAVADQAVVDYAHWGGLVDNNLDDLVPMLHEGVVGFKGFMSESGVDFARVDDDTLYQAFKTVPRNAIIAVHAENELVTKHLAEKLQAAGRTDRMAWYDSRPPFVEVEAIQRAAFWAEETERPLHIVHASTAEAVQTVVEARQRGVHITVETCPHYLFLDVNTLEAMGPIAKCAPPLRFHDQVLALWDYLLAGYVDVIGSDHSPCTLELKTKGIDNIWEAWGGISGIQSMLPIMLSEGVNKRGWPLTDLVKTMCANPARIYGLYPDKGSIVPGSDADFTVVDLNREWALKADDLFYKNKHSPYVDCVFTGQVHSTYVRGTKVYQQHEILVKPGFGQLLRP